METSSENRMNEEPINPQELEKLFDEIVKLSPREKIRKLYKVLAWRINSPVMDINLGDERYNSSLLLACLNCLMNGKMLFFGPSGTGKSTLVESIAELLFGDRLDTLQAATIHGHSQLSLEDLERAVLPSEALSDDTLDQRKRDISQVSILFIDDLSGMGEAAQTLLNSMLEENAIIRNNIRYSISPKPVFATSNRLVAGDHRTRALLDRFHIATVPTGMNPDWLASLLRGFRLLRLPSRGFNIHEDDIKNMAGEISKVSIAPLLLDNLQFFLAELNYCERISTDPHFTAKASAYLDNEESLYSLCNDCSLRENNPDIICQHSASAVSTRALEGLVQFCRAITWFIGNEVLDNASIIEAVLPYVFIHRVVPTPIARVKDPDSLTRIPWLRSLWRASVKSFEKHSEAVDLFRTTLVMIKENDNLTPELEAQIKETIDVLNNMKTPARFSYLTALEARAVEAGMASAVNIGS